MQTAPTTTDLFEHALNRAPILTDYDRIIVAFSGGKDSIACVLTLLEAGADPAKLELWHHEIDGRTGSDLMDWKCTPDYCRKFAAAFGLKIYFSWLEGGFEQEMLRNNTAKAATIWENPDGTLGRSGGNGQPGTRRKFPQVSADLTVRWCSAYLKIDVGCAAINGQTRFQAGKTLFVTGERAEESTARAAYRTFEPHRTDRRNGSKVRRHVDHFRPIHGLSLVDVWQLLERYRINPHPAYRVGIGRCSCQFCIFGNPNQTAIARAVSPSRFERLAAYEGAFGVTIHRGQTITARAARGTVPQISPVDLAAARSASFDEPIILPPGVPWLLPAGAFAESCGPS